jgi:hypothetical protein
MLSRESPKVEGVGAIDEQTAGRKYFDGDPLAAEQLVLVPLLLDPG